MKTKEQLTMDDKTEFFNVYHKQKKLKKVASDVVSNKFEISEYYLELKPLTSISDQDVIELSKMVCPDLFDSIGRDGKQFLDKEFYPSWISVKHPRKVISLDIDMDGGYTCICNEDGEYLRNIYASCGFDYLRSKGYAIPWMNISVEKQIEYGWIKLKQL